jgi:hypothetical protein
MCIGSSGVESAVISENFPQQFSSNGVGAGGVQFFTPILQHSFQFVFRKILLNMFTHEINFLRMVPKKVLDFVTKHRSFALKNSK